MVAASVSIGAATALGQVSLESDIAQLDSYLRNYNLISFGNASFAGSQDTHGGLAVAGDLFLGSGTDVAQRDDLFGLSSDPTLYVGGQLTTNGTVHLENGYAALPGLSGSWSYDSVTQRLSNNGNSTLLSSSNAYGGGTTLAGSDPRGNPTPADWDWSAMSTAVTGISTNIANATANGTMSLNSGALTFDAGAITEGVVVFDLDLSRFNNVVYDFNDDGVFEFNSEKVDRIVMNIPDDVVFAINVRNGTDGDVLFGNSIGINFNGGDNMDQLLWNIVPDSDPLTTDSMSLGGGASFYGTVLAPLVDLSNIGNVAPNGQIIAANYSHNANAELHYVGFDAPVSFSAVPEPRTWSLIALAFAAVAMEFHRRRRRRIEA